MTINSLKDLKKLIQLCQSQGVKAIEIDNIKLDLNAPAPKQRRYKQVEVEPYGTGSIEEQIKIPQMDYIESDTPTDEELLFMSSDAQSPQ